MAKGSATRTSVASKGSRKVKKSMNIFKVQKTGNKQADIIREAQGEMLQELINSLCEDFENGVDILLVYHDYKKFKRTVAECEHCDGSDMWSELSTLKGIDDQFLIHWLMSKSDMTFDDLLHLSKEPQSFGHLLQYATQLGRKLMLPAELKQTSIMVKFLDHRDMLCGKGLAKCKAEGGLDAATHGLVNENLFGYDIEFGTDGIATKLVHKATKDSITIDKDSGIREGMQISDAYDGFMASFTRPPKCKVKLALFFETPASQMHIEPFKATAYAGKLFKALEPDVTTIAHAYRAEMEKLSVGGSLESTQTEQLVGVKKARHGVQMAKAREAALKRLDADKRASAVIVANASPARSVDTD